MHEPTLPLLMFTLTFLVAGLVKGVTGMGLPTVAMGLLGAAMPPSVAAAMLVMPSLVTNVWQWLAGPAKASLCKRLWPMMLGIVLGTVGGAALLAQVEPAWSRLALGASLIAYAGYALVSPHLAVAPRLEAWLSPLVGAITGLVTGATGVFVMPAVPYLQALGLSRDELVQAMGLSFTVSTVALAAGLALNGQMPAAVLGGSALMLPPALAGMALGQWLRPRLSAVRFRQCFMGALALLGLHMAWRAL